MTTRIFAKLETMVLGSSEKPRRKPLPIVMDPMEPLVVGKISKKTIASVAISNSPKVATIQG